MAKDQASKKTTAKPGSAKAHTKGKVKASARGKAPSQARGGVETNLIKRVTWDRNPRKNFVLANMPKFQTGDTVGVYVKVKEGEKERIQVFSGIVLKVQGKASSRSFTVRKIASGVGVERTFPMASPAIDKVEVISRGKIRRGRLYYLRGLKGRSARLSSEIYFGDQQALGAADEIAVAQPPEGASGIAPGSTGGAAGATAASASAGGHPSAGGSEAAAHKSEKKAEKAKEPTKSAKAEKADAGDKSEKSKDKK